jgi:ATP-dependent Lhr-like helicase
VVSRPTRYPVDGALRPFNPPADPQVPADPAGPDEGSTPEETPAADDDPLSPGAEAVVSRIETRGAQFQDDLARSTRLLPEHLEAALAEGVGRGLLTCDSFAAVRGLIVAPSRRLGRAVSVGRWAAFRPRRAPDAEAPGSATAGGAAPASTIAGVPGSTNAGSAAPGSTNVVAERDGERADHPMDPVELVGRTLLRRYGVVFKRLLAREHLVVPWRELLRFYRRLEMRGELRGGRFVGGFAGEQYALPEAVDALRAARRKPPADAVTVSAADPLNLQGIITPDDRVARTTRQRIVIPGTGPGADDQASRMGA